MNDDDYEMNDEYDDENEEEYAEKKESLDYNFNMTNDYYDKPLRMPDFNFSLGPTKSIKQKKSRDVIKKGATQFGGIGY